MVSHPYRRRARCLSELLLSPGKSATLTVKFTKKGSYYYECTVPGHAALGMKGYFKVL